jgi:hypothetical protein
MGIADKLQGTFSSLPPFASAVAAGVQDELAPLRAEIAALQNEVSGIRSELGNLQSQLANFAANSQSQV